MGNMLRPKGTWFLSTSEDVDKRKARKWTGRIESGTVVEKVSGPRYTIPEQSQPKCVKCGIVVNPGMSHRARVYTGDITLTVQLNKTILVNPDVHSATRTIPTEDEGKIKLPKFSTGFVCADCGSDYSWVTVERKDGTTENIQRVTTLPRPVMVIQDQREGFRSGKGFARTMRVRGNTGGNHKKENYFEKD